MRENKSAIAGSPLSALIAAVVTLATLNSPASALPVTEPVTRAKNSTVTPYDTAPCRMPSMRRRKPALRAAT